MSLKRTVIILLMLTVLLLILGQVLHPTIRREMGDTASNFPASSGKGNDLPAVETDEGENESVSAEHTGKGGQAGGASEKGINGKADPAADKSCINEAGITVQERILVPEGFERVSLEAGSFGEYLRKLPLKPHGSRVMYYNGEAKPWDVHEAVIDMDVGERDLQQCADSIIRLRAEYLYEKGLYDRIHFNFTNGFNADYSAWMKGSRIKVSGNKAYWVEQGSESKDYGSFRRYLDIVFAYAGTLSLSKEMKSIPVEQMQPGDVFIYGHTPGHCVIVTDMAENKSTAEKLFILAQGYMPAQEMHILKNPANSEGNPWYPVNFGETLSTPEWKFTKDQLMRFVD